MVRKERLRPLPKASVAFSDLNEHFGVRTRKQIIMIGQKKVASKLISPFLAQTHCPSFFQVAAASVLLAVQLQSGYCQNTGEQVTSAIPGESVQAVNVKAYGAIGDGVTNDTQAFNKALASLARPAAEDVWFQKELTLFLLSQILLLRHTFVKCSSGGRGT